MKEDDRTKASSIADSIIKVNKDFESSMIRKYLDPKTEIQMLLQPVRTRFLFHFLYNASTNTISNTHYYILYIQNFSQFYLPFFTRLLQSLFPQTDLSSILTEFFAQLVVILRLRLDPDLDSIIHNQLQLDDDAFSSLQDASRSLFQSLLSHAMRFDDHTAALWGIRDASARLLSAFQRETVFGYWVQADAELYGECWRELGLEKAEAKKREMVLHVMMDKIEHICGIEAQAMYVQIVLLPSLRALTSLLPSAVTTDWPAFATWLAAWFAAFASLLRLFAAAQQHPTLSALLETDDALAAAFQVEEDSLAGLKQSVVQRAVDGLAEALKTGVVEEVLLTEYYTCSDYTTSLDDHAVRAIERAQERLEQEVTLMRNSIPEERIQRGIVFRCLRLLDKEVKERTLFIHYNRGGQEALIRVLKRIVEMRSVLEVDSLQPFPCTESVIAVLELSDMQVHSLMQRIDDKDSTREESYYQQYLVVVEKCP
ncbi:hypothetical protein AV274_3495 [Blastocystis sp. ATCC 50177/Nand II]|uniref:Cullin family profile domain-containing protein n=1 Tax=Blastocystis sp. subtype 1 (strain ATCC 50177 / NandII) TaxID=478820 RepID=A0A196SEP3_BLAHN|nr:hypothetical protein AV274_3495 [Blastocystis sp. ATCC 50177/Nand II]